MKNLITLTETQLRQLTWMEDVEGIVCQDNGDHVVLFYSFDPSYWTKVLSKEDFNASAVGQVSC